MTPMKPGGSVNPGGTVIVVRINLGDGLKDRIRVEFQK